MQIDVEAAALALDRDGHRHTGVAEVPDAAVEIGQIVHRLAGDLTHEIALVDAGSGGRAFRRRAGDEQMALGLGEVEPEPGFGRLAHAAIGLEIVEDGGSRSMGTTMLPVVL